MLFEHDDWKDFQSLETLCRKAGASQDKLTMVVAKELADNALDAAGGCEVGLLEDNGFFVHDEGGGIQGDDRAIAALFSINRPLRSSKRLRLPSRGALGNGLRVVAGTVFSSGGSLTVATRGRTLRLTPQQSGETTAEIVGQFDGEGTRVQVRFGPTLAVDEETLTWAEEAIRLAGMGTQYEGKPSPHWFDSDSFFRLVQDAGDVTVRQVIAEFEGCSEPKAGKIASPFGKGRLARELKREEAERLLKSARVHSRPVKPERLGCIGMDPLNFLPPYKIKRDTFEIESGLGNLSATIPYVVKVSAEAAKTCYPTVRISVN